MAKWQVTNPDGASWEITAPDEATEQQVIEYARQQKADAAPAPRASQGDVRAADTSSELPMERQDRAQKSWDEARAAWMKATGGALKPGQTEPQAVAEFSGQKDPRETYQGARMEQMGATGEYPDNAALAPTLAKGLASTAGFMAGGPGTATAAGALADIIDVSSNLDKAVKAGHVSEDEAATIMAKEIIKRVSLDAALNFGLPMLGQGVAAVAPQWMKDKVGAAVRRLAGASSAPSQATAKGDDLAKLTTNPERQQAVRELVKRTGGDAMPTPGQITESAGKLETAARTTNAPMFEKAETKLAEATNEARKELIRPTEQGSRQDFGRGVVSTAEGVEKAVKDRTRPIFDKVDATGAQVNMQGVLNHIDDALAQDAGSAQRLLSPAERADLENMRRMLAPDDFAPPGEGAAGLFVPEGVQWPPVAAGEDAAPVAQMGAGGVMDFVSGNKSRLRSVNPDGKPSNFYSALVARINKQADDELLQTIGRVDPKLRPEIMGARADYREMMETVYDDATKAALKALPEDVLRKFTQTGNVSEIQQYQKLLTIAQREGKITGPQMQEANKKLARGFLDGVAKDPEALASWSARLDADTPLRETWDAITEAPGGAEIKAAMGVLEQMAQVAGSMKMTTGGQFIPLSRAQHGGLGISLVTGTIRPGWVLGGIGLTGVTKALATAYTQGNKGVINAMIRAMRATQAGTPAAIQGAKASFELVDKWAQENGEEPFVFEETK